MGSPWWGSPAWPRGAYQPCLCACFPWRQEALRKIITTLAVKNEEIQSFIYSLKQMLLNVEVRLTPVGGGMEGSGDLLARRVEGRVGGGSRRSWPVPAVARPTWPGFGIQASVSPSEHGLWPPLGRLTPATSL